MRDIEQRDEWRAGGDWCGRGGGTRGDGDGAVDVGINAEGLDVAGAVLADFGDAEGVGAAAGGEGARCQRDGVAGFERELAGRKCERGLFACGPGLEQPSVGDGAGGGGIEDEGQRRCGDALRAAGDAAGFGDGLRVVIGGRDVGDLGRRGEIGFLRAGDVGKRGTGFGFDEGVGRVGEAGGGVGARAEDDLAVAFDAVEEEGEFERLEHVTRAHDAVDNEAGEHA